MDHRELDRTVVSFEQAEGRQPLPRQLQTKEISQEMRSYLWLVVYSRLEKATEHSGMYGGGDPWLNKEWESILRSYWILHEHRFADEFDNDAAWWKNYLGKIFKKGDYIEVLGFLQFVLRGSVHLYKFAEEVDLAFVRARSAYRVVGSTIMPLATEEEGRVVVAAFKELEGKGLEGARSHLRQAGEFLSVGAWADSVRDSIHSVEAAVVALAPSGKTLSDALKSLAGASPINPNLARAMVALYAYSSDEKGIRHAKVLDGTNVDEADGLYMFGSCAAFLTYLTVKHRQTLAT